MKGKRNSAKREYSAITEQRLANIEASLKEIENFINQSKAQQTQLERVTQEVEEIKRRKTKKRRRFSLFTPRKKEQPSQTQTNGMAPLLGLLQNPAVQGMLSQKSGGGKTAGLAGLDMTQMLSLLQSPMVQSLLKPQKNEPQKKLPSKGSKQMQNNTHAKKGGFNLSQAMNLLQDPMVQSLLKNMK